MTPIDLRNLPVAHPYYRQYGEAPPSEAAVLAARCPVCAAQPGKPCDAPRLASAADPRNAYYRATGRHPHPLAKYHGKRVRGAKHDRF